MKIDIKSIKPCTDTLSPCIDAYLDIDTEGKARLGFGVLVPVDALVYSGDGKLLTAAIIEYMNLSRGALAGQALMLGAQLKSLRGAFIPEGYIGQARVKIMLSPEAVQHIEALRRTDKYKRVLLKLKLRFMELTSRYVFQEALAPLDKEGEYAALRIGGYLLVLPSPVYSEHEVSVEIDEARWVSDFLPALTRTRYMVLEVPIPKVEDLELEEAKRHLELAIESLEEARKILHETLRPGPPLTALRNTLNELCHALRPLGLSEGRGQSCSFKKECIKQAFEDKELGTLIAETLTRLKHTVQTAQEPAAAHIKPSRKIQPHQIEHLIAITAHTITLLLETLKETQPPTCKQQ